MMTDEQRVNAMRIRTRNWQLARLMGFNLDSSVLTPKEKELYIAMLELKSHLLTSWESGTELFIGHPLPPFKCSAIGCSRRGKIGYEFQGQNFCKKHFNEYSNEDTSSI